MPGHDGARRTDTCCTAGQGEGWFDRPRGVAVDAAGHLYVADLAGGGRLQKFDPTGGFLWQYPLGYEPGGMYLDLEGVLWVTDVTNDQLHLYRL